MAVKFSESKTKENLMRAFAGESQARNRYTIAAGKAREAQFYAISDIFIYTAEQERAHAERFYDLLKELVGETIHIDGILSGRSAGEPGRNFCARQSTMSMKSTRTSIRHSGTRRSRKGSWKWRQHFTEIAEIEHVHEKRFAALAKMLEDGTYYGGEKTQKWICTNCGYIHEGVKAPAVCPVCRHAQGYFLPYEFACYKEEE